ncbi:MAG: hypothetical protein NTW60_00920 [Candidatus Wolfebacteria bacterium]|nr:hypothetical protein [Candidatus Wolfebacteria bacterium]
MKKKSKLYLLILPASITLEFIAAKVLAALPSKVEIPTADKLGITKSPINNGTDLTNVFENFTKAWYTFIFVYAIIFLLIAAFRYITASGNPEQLKKANSSLIWALVGIAVGILSVGAVWIIKSFLTP